MIDLFNWSLLRVSGGVAAQGVVSGHPRLKDGANIQTSWVRSVCGTDRGLELLTFSGSHYQLGAGEMDSMWWENAKVFLPHLGIPAGFLRVAWNAMMKTARQRQERIGAVPCEGSVYFEIIGEVAVPQTAFLKSAGGSPVQLGVSRESDGLWDRIKIYGGNGEKYVNIEYLTGQREIAPCLWGGIPEMWIYNRGKDTVVCRVEGEETLLCPGSIATVCGHPVRGGALEMK